ncbi:MAG TPA: alpha/beta hydrolase [Pirellulales bacterium]
MKPPFAISLGWLLAVFAALGCTSVNGARPPSPGALETIERRLTFHPVKLPETWPVNSSVDSVWFLVDGGVSRRSWLSATPVPIQLKLHGILAEPKSQSEEKTSPRAVVLYCHGTAGCVDFVAERMRRTADKFNVVMMTFDYRGYGRSEGEPEVSGILADARSARRWLAQRTGVREGDVVLMGTSLGGGVATALAGTDGCRGLILEDTFTSLGDVADEHAIPGTKPSELMKARLASVQTIKNYHGPLLQRHGDDDPLIPFEQGQRLFAAAPGPKKFITSPGAGHNDPPTPEFEEAMEEFFHFLPPVAASSTKSSASSGR